MNIQDQCYLHVKGYRFYLCFYYGIIMKHIYTPKMQRGSAMAVTHKSAMAKFTINSFPDLLILLITVNIMIIKTFPIVPTRSAIPTMTMQTIASVGLVSRSGSVLIIIAVSLLKPLGVLFELLLCKRIRIFTLYLPLKQPFFFVIILLNQ